MKLNTDYYGERMATRLISLILSDPIFESISTQNEKIEFIEIVCEKIKKINKDRYDINTIFKD